MSVRFTKKSFDKTPSFLVKIPDLSLLWLAPRALIPPIRTVISGADNPRS